MTEKTEPLQANNLGEAVKTATAVKTHTPLPWVANDQHSGSTPWRVESDACDYVNDGWVVAEFFGPDAETNAALIVRAVNSHEALIAALESALEIAESWIHDQLDGTSAFNGAWAELGPVRAALTKAKAGS